MRGLEFFKTKQTLLGRIADLERTVEALSEARGFLERQLEKTDSERRELLHKIFDISSINRVVRANDANSVRPGNTGDEKPASFINMARKGADWLQVRKTLEEDSQRKYWENKKLEQDQRDKEKAELERQLEASLEGELGKGNNLDAS